MDIQQFFAKKQSPPPSESPPTESPPSKSTPTESPPSVSPPSESTPSKSTPTESPPTESPPSKSKVTQPDNIILEKSDIRESAVVPTNLPTISSHRTIEDINISIINRIHRYMPWEEIETKNGNTQKAERIYMYHIRRSITDEGGVITETTGSQKPKDIRSVKYPGIKGTFDYEGKKINSNSGNFCLNDTLPEGDNVYYIFLRVKGHSVDIRKASMLTNYENVTFDYYSEVLDELSDCVVRLRSRGESANDSDFKELFNITVKLLELAVKSRMMKLYDYGQMFKFTTTFGFFKSRPRPNWFLSCNAL